MANQPEKYLQRPMEIQAMHYFGNVAEKKAVTDWVAAQYGFSWIMNPEANPDELGIYIEDGTGDLVIRMQIATYHVKPGDWVTVGPSGVLFPYTNEQFEASYAGPVHTATHH